MVNILLKFVLSSNTWLIIKWGISWKWIVFWPPPLILRSNLFFFLRFYLLIFRERGREEKERERNITVWEKSVAYSHPQLGTWPATQACDLTGNRTSSLSVRRPALNPLSHTRQVRSNNFSLLFLILGITFISLNMLIFLFFLSCSYYI